MRGDHAGVLQPRDAITSPMAGVVAQISGHQVLPGHKGTTSTTYRWEDNTDPVILARVWNGTETVFSVHADGAVHATEQIWLSASGVPVGKVDTAGIIYSYDGGFVVLASLGGVATVIIDNNQGAGSAGGIGISDGSGAPDTNLYRSAANVLKTDDQFVAADGLTGKYVSGAGRVNGADTDFTVTPGNGTIYTVRNSTDGKGYLTTRVNGSWKAVEVT